MISVIICSANADKARTISPHFSSLLQDEPHEALLIDNPVSLSRGYNEGIARSCGEVLVFAHDDIEILTSHFAPRLRRHLERFDLVGVAGTTRLCAAYLMTSGPPYVYGQVAHPEPPGFGVSIFSVPAKEVEGIQALDGLFFACKRRVVEVVHFDEQWFDGFHLYDVDFTFAAYLAGFRLGVCTDIPILHASIGRFDAKWRYYATLFEGKYRGKLAPPLKRPYKYTIVNVETKAEILEVMGCAPEP
jgi:Glycosyltransferase like family